MMQEFHKGLRSRSFTVTKAPLTAIESIALECLKQIASEERRATKAEICAAIGSDNIEGGTASDVMRRLEAKGYIERKLFQRGFMVTVIETGHSTLPPENTAPHWRFRTEAVPSPAIHHIRQRAQPLAQMIEASARKLGKPLSEFLIDCVYVGYHRMMQEGEL